MPKKQITKPIRRAYCVEFDEVFSIEDAISASAKRAAEGKNRRFVFLCSSPECRKQRIPITGVLYHRDPKKEKVPSTPCFKVNGHIDHLPSCEWVIGYENTKEAHVSNDGDKEGTKLPNKKSNYIDVFTPPTREELLQEDVRANTGTRTYTTSTSGTRPGSRVKKTDNLNRTKQLRKMVDQYLAIKQTNYKQLYQLGFTVHGQFISWHNYFQPIQGANFDTHQGIFFGKCSIHKFKQGAFLNFWDKVKNLKASLFLSKKIIDEYRHRDEILNIINHPNHDYFTVFFMLPNLIPSKNKQNEPYMKVDVLPQLLTIKGHSKKPQNS